MMSPSDCLPVILVSAGDEAAANTLISEIIDNEVTIETDIDAASTGRMWRLVNKYYTVDVCVVAHVDGQPLPVSEQAIEAHVIFLSEDECLSSVAERRASVCAGASVCVCACAGSEARVPTALTHWATDNHYELVPLQHDHVHDRDHDEDEARGVRRVRDALHAHTWPGLTRLDVQFRAGGAHSSGSQSADSSDTEWSEWQRAGEGVGEGVGEGGGEEADEDEDEVSEAAAGRFAAALGALPEAARRCRRLPRAQRHAHAEALLAAFCDALAMPL